MQNILTSVCCSHLKSFNHCLQNDLATLGSGEPASATPGIWTTRPKDNSPQTISPQIYQPYNVLAVCFLPGFSTNDSILYVLVVYFLQTFLRCVEIIVFILEVKAKERLVESVKMQSEICERRWIVLLEQNDHM